MKYGYARVSTAGQARDGNSLEAQRKELIEAGAEVIFSDAFTGTITERPEFQKMLAELKEGDTVIVTKLDRFARSALQGLTVLEDLSQKGVVLHVLNMGLFDNTPTGKLMRTVFLAFAEFERDMILQRTSEGKAVAKANNPMWREGRKKSIFLSSDVVKRVENGEMSISAACRELGISRASWYNKMKEIKACKDNSAEEYDLYD